jgi:phenylpyruvate tautomerase PptA (4-oxalocrotonate tautomerase family)
VAIYTCTTPEGALSAEQRELIASEITRIHTAHSGDRPNMVWVVFDTVSPGSIYAAGKPAEKALIVGLFREDRSTEVRAQVLNELHAMYKKVTGLSNDQIWISLTEIPASDGMMFGAILPEVGHEAEWLAQIGSTH